MSADKLLVEKFLTLIPGGPSISNDETKERKEAIERMPLVMWLDLKTAIEQGKTEGVTDRIESNKAFLMKDNGRYLIQLLKKAIENNQKAILEKLLSLQSLSLYEYDYTLTFGVLPLEDALLAYRGDVSILKLLIAHHASSTTDYVSPKDISENIQKLLAENTVKEEPLLVAQVTQPLLVFTVKDDKDDDDDFGSPFDENQLKNGGWLSGIRASEITPKSVITPTYTVLATLGSPRARK